MRDDNDFDVHIDSKGFDGVEQEIFDAENWLDDDDEWSWDDFGDPID